MAALENRFSLSQVVEHSRLTCPDEERTLVASWLDRKELIDPLIASGGALVSCS